MSHLVNTTEKMAADLAAFQLMKATTATAEKPGGDVLDEQYVKTLAANKKRFNKEQRLVFEGLWPAEDTAYGVRRSGGNSGQGGGGLSAGAHER